MKTVLVIDDDKDTLKLVSSALRQEKYMVFTAINGEEGLKELEKGVDLIIVDIMMPRMSGIDVIKKIPKDGPKVMILSVLNEHEIKTKYPYLEKIVYVQKPVDLDLLIKEVKKLVEKK